MESVERCNLRKVKSFIKPYQHKSLAKRLNEKLSPRFYGPYRILSRIGTVAYLLELPSHASIHPVFYVSQLRKAIGTSTRTTNIPPQLCSEMELVVEPEDILQIRQLVGDTNVLEVLVKWKGLPEF